MQDSPSLAIQLLGAFRIVAGDTSLRLDQPRLQRLLVYLLLHRHHPRPRQQVAFTLWPDTSEEQALRNLRTLLTRLRQSLPDLDRYVEVSTYALKWRHDAPCHLDVSSFEDACAAAVEARQRGQASAAISAYERATGLYTGDLTPGWYDEWLVPERERLRDLHQTVLETLCKLLADAGRRRDALSRAQQLLRADPLHETAYRLLMQIHLDLDDRAAALRVYHTCATTLRNELGVDPSPGTQALYLRVLTLDDEPAPPPHAVTAPMAANSTPGAAALVGRQTEWGALRRAWQSAASGRAQVVLISGEAGIGKTRLAEELLAWVERQGATTAVARCYAGGVSLAYAPVAEWLRSPGVRANVQQLEGIWRSETARLLPDLLADRPDLSAPGPMTEAWQRQRFFQALNRGILGAATEHTDGARPLLLLLDDAQWCDPDTLDWLHFLVQANTNVPLLVLATVRIEEVDEEHPLNALRLALAREELANELSLAPLTAAETATLAGELLGRPLVAAQAAQLFQDTEGNPLFAVEMVRAGMAAGESGRSGAGESGQPLPAGDAPALPPRVSAVIRRRLALLSPGAQALAETAAVLGRAFTFAVLAHASGQDDTALVQGLDELWRRRIVREQGADAYDFSHDQIRAVAYAGLSPMRRRAAHIRAAEALVAVYRAELSPMSAQIAEHYGRAGISEQAITYYRQAASTAQRVFAFSDALDLLKRAVSLLSALPDDSSRRQKSLQLYEQVGDIHGWLAHHDSALEAYRVAQESISADAILDRARLHRKTGNTLDRARCHYDEIAAEYEAANTLLESAKLDADKAWWEEWCQIQLEYLLLLYWCGRTEAMNARLVETRPLIEQYGTPTQRATLLSRLSSHLNRANRFTPTAAALEYARAAMETEQSRTEPKGRPYLVFSYGFNLLWHRKFGDAESQLTTALEIAIQAVDVSLQSRCLAYLALLHRMQRCPGKVREIAERGLETANSTGQQDYIGANLANLAWVAWQENDRAEAERLASAALGAWDSMSHHYPLYWQALLPLLSIALDRGEFDQALDFARTMIDPSQQRLPDPIDPLLQQADSAARDQSASAARGLLADALSAARTLALL